MRFRAERAEHKILRFMAESKTSSAFQPTFRKDRKYREFREWLEDKCAINDPLPQGCFLHSGLALRECGCNAPQGLTQESLF